MDLWRVLLIGAVVAGVILLLLPAPQEIPGLVGGVLIEEGTYVIERAGQLVGEESFALWLADGVYRVNSTLQLGAQRVEATLVTDRSWNPLYYAEKGPSSVSIRIVEGRPRIATGSGLFRRETALSVLPPFAFLGAEAFGPWFAVYRYLQAQDAPAEATAVLPARRTTAALGGSVPEPVGLVAGGRTLPAEVYHVQLGEAEVWLYGQGELLLGGNLAGEGWTFYLKEILPDGIEIAP